MTMCKIYKRTCKDCGFKIVIPAKDEAEKEEFFKRAGYTDNPFLCDLCSAEPTLSTKSVSSS